MVKLKTKIKRTLNKTAKENVAARNVIRGGMNAYRLLHYKFDTFYRHIDEKTVLFSSFEGRSYSDNPKAIFEYMVRSKQFEDYTLVWGIRKGRLKRTRKEFQKLLEEVHPEISNIPLEDRILEDLPGPTLYVVQQNGKQWRKYLASSKYWIFNYKVPEFLKPKHDQIFLQTWHGTPLKRLGFDLEHFDNVLNTAEGMKKRYGIEVQKFSYFISPNKFSTERFKSAWRMDNFGKGDIILETGYPRNDILTNHTYEQTNAIKAKIFGHFYLPYEQLSGKHKTIVLYAPTYRSDQHEDGVGYTYKDGLDFDRLQKDLQDNFIILFRAHYLIAKNVNFDKYDGFIYNVSNYEDMSDLLLISDILVTDYSSSMFDYAILKRPMIYYMYDLEHYRDDSNGFYFNPEETLPGPIVRTEDELVTAIKKTETTFVYDEKYRKFNERFNALENGTASKRVVEQVFS